MKRLYRFLLRLYPARFREEYAGPMERQFLDEYRDAGGPGRAWLLLRASTDLLFTVPAEIAREFFQDARYALRAWRQRSWATLLALTALALAIGVTTGVFSVLNAALLRSLPFREPERLVSLSLAPVSGFQGKAAFQSWVQRTPYLAEAAGYSVNEMSVGLSQRTVRAQVAETTAGFLRMLGSEPDFGRGFAPGEDVPGHDSVAVIGYGFWQQAFGGDPAALGSTLRVGGVPFTIMGVAPRAFDYPGHAAVWIPSAFDLGKVPKGGVYWWSTIARLKPGFSLPLAARLYAAEMAELRRGQAAIPGYTAEAKLTSLHQQLAGPVRSASLVLMGMVTLVLLIACANVAHLLLSQTSERRRELATRAALGASRARLYQQLATEALLLTGIAALAGLLVARWTAGLVAGVEPAALTARSYTILDWRVLGFAVAVALLTGLLFGVLPATLIGRLQPGQQVLRQGSGGRGTSRMRGLLMAMQAALTVVLAAGSLSLGRSFLRLMETDLAFRTENVVTLNASLSGTDYESKNRESQYYDVALQRLRAVPGVESAAAVSCLPLLTTAYMGGQFKLDSGRQISLAVLLSVTPDYFRTMGTPILEGRDFQAAGREEAGPIVIVTERLARAFGTTSVVGRKLDLGWDKPNWHTIVGVVRDQRYTGPQSDSAPQVFQPLSQAPWPSVTFVARVMSRPEAALPVCRAALAGTDRNVPIFDAKTLDQRLADTLAKPRIYTTATVFLAAFALLLSVVGAYGVASYSLAQRTREIGIRIAVGASPGGLRATLLGQSMLPVVLGLLAGIYGAAMSGRFLQHLINTAPATRLPVCAGAALLLAAAVGTAVWSALRRILRLDATAALRVE